MRAVNKEEPLPEGKLKRDTRDTIVFHDEMDQQYKVKYKTVEDYMQEHIKADRVKENLL
jgi:hypothetical protein